MSRAILSSALTRNGQNDTELESAIGDAGLNLEYRLPHGFLVSGEEPALRQLEEADFRVYQLDEADTIQLGRYSIESTRAFTRTSEADVQKVPAEDEPTWTHYLVQLIAPPIPIWQAELEACGARVVEAISERGLFVEATASAISAISALDFVVWTSLFHPGFRIHENLDGREGLIDMVRILVFNVEEAAVVQALLTSMNAEVHDVLEPDEGEVYHTFLARLTFDQTLQIAHQKGVRWVEYASPEPGLEGEAQDQIIASNLNSDQTGPVPGYLDFLTNNAGASGKNTFVSICDTGVCLNAYNNQPVKNNAPNPSLQGRQEQFIDYSNGKSTADTKGHGSHVAGIAAGNAADQLKDADGFLYGLGLAPRTKYINQNAIAKEAPWPPKNGFQRLAKDAKFYLAEIMNNSWTDGSGTGAGYTANSQTWDKLVRDPAGVPALKNLVVVFSAGNSGPQLKTITSPKEAKNPITVGSTLKNNNIDSLSSFSSRGPAVDGRILPNVVAPGSDIASVRSSKSTQTPISGTDGKYTFMSGTSMAAPAVTGVAALLSEWWTYRKGTLQHPSPAMIKAMLINGADDIHEGKTGRTDAQGNPILIGHIPNNDQGWGRLNLKNMLVQHPLTKRATTLYYDQANPLTQYGQEFETEVSAILPTEPMRITLVWTDKYGAPGANPALVNNLNLEVTSKLTNKVYKGNVFDPNTGYSKPGGTFDRLNNIECIYIEKPDGRFTVKVIAADLKGNAKPPFDNTPWQDFALVIENAEEKAPNPVSVSLCVDRSPSMKFYGYVGTTKTAGANSVNLTYINDQLGIVSYSSNQTVELSMTEITATAVRDRARRAFYNINFDKGSRTAIGDAMKKSGSQLQNAKHNKGILLLTDGHNNDGKIDPIVEANALKAKKIKVFTLAMGPKADQGLLQQIANISGGVMKYMPSIDDLFQVYNYLRSDYAKVALAFNEQAQVTSQGITIPIHAADDKNASFTLQWKDSSMKYVPHPPTNPKEITLELQNPAGAKLKPEEIFVQPVIGSGFIMFRFQRGATPGPWTVKLITYHNQPMPYTLAAFEDEGGLALNTLHSENMKVNASESISLKWQVLENGEPVSGIEAEIEVVAPRIGIHTIERIYANELAAIELKDDPLTQDLPENLARIEALRNALLPDIDLYGTSKSTYQIGGHKDSDTLTFEFPNTVEKGVYNFHIKTRGTGHLSDRKFQRVYMESVLVE